MFRPEDIVQDSFAAAHGVWQALPDTDAVLSYLRRAVVRLKEVRVRAGLDGTDQDSRTTLPL